MKRFRYSLQKVLDLREFQLKQAEIELGKVNAKIADVQRQLSTIAQQRANVTRAVDSSDDMFIYEHAPGYVQFLEQKKEQCLLLQAQLQMEAEQKKDIVRAAMQKEKVLEKLKDHKFADWKDEVLKEEELIMDDVVTAKYHAPR